MLVLSRKAGESLVINDNIEIKIIEIVGDKVRIGVEAPREMVILRKELLQTVESNKDAANSAPPRELLDFIASIK